MQRSAAVTAAWIGSVALHVAALAALTLWAGFDPTPPVAPAADVELLVRYEPVPRPPQIAPPLRNEPSQAEPSQAEPSQARPAPHPIALPTTATPRPELHRRTALTRPLPSGAPPRLVTIQPVPPQPYLRPRTRTLQRAPQPRARVEMPAKQEPTLVSKLQPTYPRECRRRGHEGVVEVRLAIAADGTVTSVEIIRAAACRHMNAAARETALQLRYLPAVRDGAAVAGTTTLRLRYALDD